MNLLICVLVFFVTVVTSRESSRFDKWMHIADEMKEQLFFNLENPIPAPTTSLQQEWFKSLGNRYTKSSEQSTRKEVRTLTTEEWQSLVTAVWESTNTFPDPDDPTSEYHLMVTNHLTPNAPAAHFGAAFLSWHREFLYRYETMLQSHGMVTGLPYWDLTLDSYLDDPFWSSMWSDAIMGENRGVVDSGSFSMFPLMERCILNPSQGFEGSETLERNFGNTSYTKDVMYSDEDVEFFFSKSRYAELCRIRYEDFELQHDFGHRVVNGQMQDVQCSPSDPIFFIYHSYMDYLWEEFRVNHQETDLETEYPTEGHGSRLHDSDAAMKPFEPLLNIDGLSLHYTDLHYTYAPTPDVCVTSGDCGSPSYLRCDTVRSRCISKLRNGAPCDDSIDGHCIGQCVNGVCV